MIEVTRLNGHPIVINAELIKFVEQNPDTVITLVTGDKLVVRETALVLMQRVIAYRRQLLELAEARSETPRPSATARDEISIDS